MNSRRDAMWLLAALLFGLFALPPLVYFTGVTLLGPYARGGPTAFFADFLADLVRLSWPAWALVVGPLLVMALVRLLARFVARGSPG